MLKNVKDKFHKNLRSFIENNRHIFELTMDVIHFYILPPFLIFCCYYTYWWWNASFVDHSSFVDVQFSLRGNTVSVDKKMKHAENFYWLCEVDYPSRLIDVYQLDERYRVSRRHSRYIYRYEKPSLVCVTENISTGKTLPVKFRNFFYRDYCQNVHHYIRAKKKISYLKLAKEPELLNKSLNVEVNNTFKNLKVCDIFKNTDETRYNSFFVYDNYNEYKKKKSFETWGYKQRLSKIIGKNLSKNIVYKKSNIFFKNDTKFKVYNLRKFKFDMLNEEYFYWINNNKLKSYNYNRLKNLNTFNKESFFSPFDFEVKYLEYKKQKENYYYEVDKKNIFLRKIKNFISKNKIDWKQFYLNDLNFKTKKKLLLESRLRNRIYQEKLLYWSIGKRVPYKFKHDNLLGDKMFKPRSHYYDVYDDINKKRRSSTNKLSITNWGNNSKTQKKHIYFLDRAKYIINKETITSWFRNRRYQKRTYTTENWGYNGYWRVMHDDYFFLSQRSRRRYVKSVNSLHNNRISYRLFFQRLCFNANDGIFNLPFTKEYFKSYSSISNKNSYLVNNNRVLSYKLLFQYLCINANENLYDLPFTKEYFKNDSSHINNKNPYLLDVSYKKKTILKTESNYCKNISLTKKNTKLMTSFPLRHNSKINFVYISKKPYD